MGPPIPPCRLLRIDEVDARSTLDRRQIGPNPVDSQALADVQDGIKRVHQAPMIGYRSHVPPKHEASAA
eukprot:375279-Pyramimonas_sp.AAC.1